MDSDWSYRHGGNHRRSVVFAGATAQGAASTVGWHRIPHKPTAGRLHLAAIMDARSAYGGSCSTQPVPTAGGAGGGNFNERQFGSYRKTGLGPDCPSS